MCYVLNALELFLESVGELYFREHKGAIFGECQGAIFREHQCSLCLYQLLWRWGEY